MTRLAPPMTPAERSWDRYLPLLHLHVRQLQLGRLYRSRYDSWDVVQEALSRAIKNLDRFRGTSEAEFVAWLQKIARNTLCDLYRRENAGRRIPPKLLKQISAASSDGKTSLGALLMARQPGASTLVVQEQDLLCLAAAVDRLPDDERDAVIAHYILGLPLTEVAKRIERTEKGVAGLLYRGKRHLRKLLADLEDVA